MILLVGNKGDVTSDGEVGGEKREVEREEAERWAQEEGLAGYVETSAKSGQGVEEVRSLFACICLSLSCERTETDKDALLTSGLQHPHPPRSRTTSSLTRREPHAQSLVRLVPAFYQLDGRWRSGWGEVLLS